MDSQALFLNKQEFCAANWQRGLRILFRLIWCEFINKKKSCMGWRWTSESILMRILIFKYFQHYDDCYIWTNMRLEWRSVKRETEISLKTKITTKFWPMRRLSGGSRNSVSHFNIRQSTQRKTLFVYLFSHWTGTATKHKFNFAFAFEEERERDMGSRNRTRWNYENNV